VKVIRLMISKNLNRPLEVFPMSLNKGICPVCGMRVTEVYRRKQNGAWFVWCECSRGGCHGAVEAVLMDNGREKYRRWFQ
jgi:hypothetical protein